MQARTAICQSTDITTAPSDFSVADLFSVVWRLVPMTRFTVVLALMLMLFMWSSPAVA